MTTLLFRFFNSIKNNYSFNILLTIIYKLYIINSKECFLGNGLTTQYEYENEQGLLSKVSYGSSGKYQTFEYNLQGEPTFTQKDSLPYRYDYDDNGNLLKESMGVTRINEYTYDELNRLNTTLDEFSATTQYGYDANNNIVSKEISHYRGATVNLSNAGTTIPFTNVTHHTEEMTYNAANQLTRREETVTGTNNGTTITQTSTDTYTYTANGSMSTKQETLGSSALSKTYSYNDRNQLIQYKEGSTVKGTYTYDPEGFRSSKTAGGKTTCFYWDRGYTINESDGTNFTARNTIGIGGIIARKTSAATTYLAKDIHGDTAYTLNTNGTKDAGYRYFAFGEQWSHSGSQDNPYRYCGEYIDNETGFIYLRNRYYDPKLGRFISEDPAKSGSNWYVYCENNPLKFVDPWGLEPSGMSYYIVVFAGINTNQGSFEYVGEEIKSQILNQSPNSVVNVNTIYPYDDSISGGLIDDSIQVGINALNLPGNAVKDMAQQVINGYNGEEVVNFVGYSGGGVAASRTAEQLNEDGWGASINKIIRVGSPNLYVGNWFVNRTVDLALIDDPIQTITFTRGRMYTPPIKHYIYDLTTNGNGFNKHTQYWNPWNRNLNKTVAHIVYNMR